MLNALIQFSLKNRMLVVAAAVLVMVYGIYLTSTMPVDVFPSLNRPTVTVFLESEGLATEEIESLVVRPVEFVLNGAPGVERVRSVSTSGQGMIFVEFGWGTDIYRGRQIVTEKLALVGESLPEGTSPQLGPISSVMGEIMLIALRPAEGSGIDALALRDIADWEIRPRLMAIPGISQVISIGGGRRQIQVLLNPERMRKMGVGIGEVEEALRQTNVAVSGGWVERGQDEFLIRGVGRIESLEQVSFTLIRTESGVPITIGDVARVAYGAQTKRGEALLNGSLAVVMSIQKQPDADTLPLTEKILEALEGMRESIGEDVEIVDDLFRQADFIERAVDNVTEALRDGAILVAILLLLFLLNWRTTAITLTAIPLSFITALAVFNAMGVSVNTMTLGGLAVAIGMLVDDAIVGVENVYRRLRENAALEHPRQITLVVFEASKEIRNSIVYATVIIVLVFLPLFFMGGLEGRFFMPLGVAFVTSLVASLFVSLTVTPVLCDLLLSKVRPSDASADPHSESAFVRWLTHWNRKILDTTLANPKKTIAITIYVFLGSLALVALMGRVFLPPFNEGTFTINLRLPPGTSLTRSTEFAAEASRRLLEVPGTRLVAARIGRAEEDEHAEPVNSIELEVEVHGGGNRSSTDAMSDDFRAALEPLGATSTNIGQPISHRLDHLLSGVRAQLAVKIFGDDLDGLRAVAEEVRDAMARVPGVTDLAVEEQVPLPQIRVVPRPADLARHGIRVGELLDNVAMALAGEVITQVLEGQRSVDLVLRLDEPFRRDLRSVRALLIDLPGGEPLPLEALADVYESTGPNQILRENTRRRIVVQANTTGRDLGTIVAEIEAEIDRTVELPQGYFITFGGQFESQQAATRTIATLGILAVLLVFVILFAYLGYARLALIVMANLPLSVIGGVIAVFLTGGVLSIASMVGFIAVFGIASRNGIMLVSHLIHLMEHEGESFDLKMIVRGSLERLVPVMMTALATGLALIPITMAAGVPGKELIHPMAVVILGGLLSSTPMTLIVTPCLFWLFGRPVWEGILAKREAAALAVQE